MKFARKHQDVCVNLQDLIPIVNLPEGLRWKDFHHEKPLPNDPFWIDEPTMNAEGSRHKSTQYFDTMIVGIERERDGKWVHIEVCGLAGGVKQPLLIRLFEFAHRLDVAIGELNG